MNASQSANAAVRPHRKMPSTPVIWNRPCSCWNHVAYAPTGSAKVTASAAYTGHRVRLSSR